MPKPNIISLKTLIKIQNLGLKTALEILMIIYNIPPEVNMQILVYYMVFRRGYIYYI